MTEQQLGSAKEVLVAFMRYGIMLENRYHRAKLSTAGEVMRYK